MSNKVNKEIIDGLIFIMQLRSFQKLFVLRLRVPILVINP